jgi:hypothetical protein
MITSFLDIDSWIIFEISDSEILIGIGHWVWLESLETLR